MVNKTLFIDNHNNSGLPGYSGKSPIYISAVTILNMVEIWKFHEKTSQNSDFLTIPEQNGTKPEQNQNLHCQKGGGKFMVKNKYLNDICCSNNCTNKVFNGKTFGSHVCLGVNGTLNKGKPGSAQLKYTNNERKILIVDIVSKDKDLVLPLCAKHLRTFKKFIAKY